MKLWSQAAHQNFNLSLKHLDHQVNHQNAKYVILVQQKRKWTKKRAKTV